jgi:hypothetical protein
MHLHPISRRKRVSRDGKGNDSDRKAAIPKGPTPMRRNRVPNFKTIEEMAEFWDTHDTTDFEEEFEIVESPFLKGSNSLRVSLKPDEAKAVAKLAKIEGISSEELVRNWVSQRIATARTLRKRR